MPPRPGAAQTVPMTHATLAAELFLLLTNNAGRQNATMVRRPALNAAALLDLELRERITVGEGRNPRLEVRDRTAPGDPALDVALAFLAGQRSAKTYQTITHHKLDLTGPLGEQAEQAGSVVRKDGWFTTSWPVADPGIEQNLRNRLAAAIADPGLASRQDAYLLELLRALRVEHRVLKDEAAPLGRRELARVVEDVSTGHPVARNLHTAMQAVATTATSASF